VQFWHFSYVSNGSRRTRAKVHHLRDGDAFAELMPMLLSIPGATYGGLIRNSPPEHDVDESLIHVSRLGLTEQDLLVLTTRPPLSDTTTRNRRIRRSKSQLERAVFRALQTHINHCKRDEVVLTQDAAASLRPEFGNRAAIGYYMQQNARVHRLEAGYDSLSALEEQADRFRDVDKAMSTAVYLVRTGPIYRGGPGVLCTFGLSGTFSLCWAHLLRTSSRLRGVLERALQKPTFVMAEIVVDRDVPQSPRDLSFAHAWGVTVVTADSGDRGHAGLGAPASETVPGVAGNARSRGGTRRPTSPAARGAKGRR
jgi:hypothetical protein